MPNERDKAPVGFVTVLDHLEAVGRERDQRYHERFNAMQEAVLKAEAAANRRFESVNEFRDQMGDMQSTLARKSEVDIRIDALEKKIDTLVEHDQLVAGRGAGFSAAWLLVCTLFGMVVSGVGVVLAMKRT